MTEDLNIGIVLQYRIDTNFNIKGSIDADKLVRQARDCGFRGVSVSVADKEQEKMVEDACQKYSIKFCQKRPAIVLGGPDILAKLIAARLDKQNIYFEIDLTQDGTIKDSQLEDLELLRKWVDRFGHAYYEMRPDKTIKTDANAHVFKNELAEYQIYVFIHQPLPEKIELTNLPHIEKAMWIDTRKDLDFSQKDDKVTINLKRDDEDEKFTIYGLRLQAHRPEDDMGPTKF
ncbi:hypothetical protein [Lactobacillus hominis]|uniref:Uncharacterized protein n=1 Tax=Lactobacillus hominis DSM 23910 = CRBIP 24.179 TaxID=1423758 RepID=I7JV13_9LACO|nr:hypothetical protein [Lactobacillus hominis]KRM84518.1 hypothetical protein FC41_GL000660 [Lactobacillus hominis DSM 23910 = CRBIP 24.179]CCI82036.1 Putative uncharacterized protein [Lactobacillus hominis DSM 23910 = CRBIP 24.179]